MARSRKKSAAKELGAAVEVVEQPNPEAPDIFDAAIQAAADQAAHPVEHFEQQAATPMTEAQVVQATPPEQHERQPEPHHEQNGEKKRGPRYTYSERAGNNLVRMVDDGNFRGLGIRLDFADKDEKPSADVLRVIREEKDGQRGMGWVPSLGQSRKGVGRTPEEAIKSRLDVERRTFEAAEQMRKEQAEREQGR